jgi:hypothetical protein
MNKPFLLSLLLGSFIHDDRVPELMQSCIRSSVPMAVGPCKERGSSVPGPDFAT